MRDKIALAMITTDRSVKKRANYIFESIRQLHSAGVFSSDCYDSLTIHIDGPQENYKKWIEEVTAKFPNVYVKMYDKPAGSAGNALRAHRELINRNDVDWVMMLEDDLHFSEYFLSKILGWLRIAQHPKRLVYQIGVWTEYVDNYGRDKKEPWFDFYGHNEESKNGFSMDGPTKLMRGSQCYVMRPEHMKCLADYIEGLLNAEKSGILIHHDGRIREWLNIVAKEHNDNEMGLIRAPRPYTYVQHIGKESAVYDVKMVIDPSFYFQAREYFGK